MASHIFLEIYGLIVDFDGLNFWPPLNIVFSLNEYKTVRDFEHSEWQTKEEKNAYLFEIMRQIIE